MTTQTLRELNTQWDTLMAEIEANGGEKTADMEEERRDLIVRIHDEKEFVEAWHNKHQQILHDDPTGQDLDNFYGED